MTLPLTGIGSSYVINSYSGTQPSVWNQPAPSSPTGTMTYLELLAWWKTKGMGVAQLTFCFNGSNPDGEAILDYSKMDTVAGYFNSIGVKINATYLQSGWYTFQYASTNNFINDWKTFATRYHTGTILGDAFACFSIFQEPYWGVDQDLYATKLAEFQRWTEIVKAIHDIDPNRVVKFPFPFLTYSTPNEWLADMARTSINGHTILQEPNVKFDILHGYWFPPGASEVGSENVTGDPVSEATMYNDNYIVPCVAALGASNCHYGETYLWDYQNGVYLGAENHQQQVTFLTAILSYCVDAGVGFNLMNTLPYYNSDLVACLENSGYLPEATLTLPFHDDFASLTNWQVKTGTWGIS